MNEEDQAASPVEFRDRTVGLVVFGVIQILMGLFCMLMIPMVLLAMTIGPPTAAAGDTRTMLLVVAEYAALAVIGIWLGIGSILARRWARALTLVLAWIVLVTGVVTMVFVSLFMGGMFQEMARQGKVPAEAVLGMQVMMGGMLGCFYIVIPGAFVLFYQSKHVRATCEAKDRRVRWTDRCPLPVLALCVLFGFGAFCMLACAPLYGGVFPWFGRFLDGPAGMGLMLACSPLLAFLAWGLYKLKKWAWLGTIVLLIVGTASSLVTFSRVGFREMYEKMQFSEEQLEMLESTGIFDTMNMPWMIGISCAVYLAYVLWVGRYFCSCSCSCSPKGGQ